MNYMIMATNEFEGRNITTLTYHDEPAWIAREIGEAIGYSQGGKRFASYINGDWADEFIEGQDHVLLTGQELSDLKPVFKGCDSRRMKSNRGLILLFESGLSIALARTRKPVCKRLRRFFADEVLPQITRDGSSLPEHEVTDGQLHSRDGSAIDPKLAREQRFARRLELDDRKFQTNALKDLLKTLRATGTCDEDVLTTYDVVATETATGRDLAELKPATEEHWVSPTEIAGKLGVSPQRVGLTISKLGLRGNIQGLARAVVSKATGHQRTVTSYVYSPRAVQQITDELTAGGRRPLRLM